MIRTLTAFALTGLALTGVSAAAEVAPGDGYSVRLARFGGALYYTVEPDGYRVVATLASGAEAPPIRFVATLVAGQRALISVPQRVGEPSLDFEIRRDGDVLSVGEPASAPTADLVNLVPSPTEEGN